MVTDQVTRRTRRLAIVLATATVLAVGASLPTAYATDGEDSSGLGNHGRLEANLTGAKERPGPGDDDGRGKARLQLKNDRICFELSWRNIDAPTAAHVHIGSREEAGPVVVGLLGVPAPGLGAPVSSIGGCAPADPALIADIRSHPSAYYVNIHNVAFPAGAIRGQLHR
jgi:hypothetical protein